MRKLTGYIGAIIIVFALMGSILLGYALNINGTTATVNAYDPVTDVSGLYTHSQEPAYIDYNPASNYIGYNYYKQYNSDVGNDTYKQITDGTLYFSNDGKITLNGNLIGDISTVQTMRIPFISDGLSMEFNPFGTGNYYITGIDFYYTLASDLTININGSTTTLTVNGNTYTYLDVAKNICYWTIDNTYDYYKINGRLAGNVNNVYCYVNGVTDLYTYSKSDPNLTPLNPNNDISTIITRGFYYWTGQQNGVLDNPGPTAPTWGPFVNHEYVDTNVYRVMANYTQWIGSVWYNNQHNPVTIDGYSIFYPKTVNNDGGTGINYTESNRVNNYPVVRSDASTTTEITTLTVGNLTATDYWPEVPNGWLKTGYLIFETQPIYPNDDITAPYYYTTINLSDYNYGATMLHQYKLSDILVNYNIPIGTQTLKITTNSNDIRAYPYYNLDANIIGFVNASNNGFIQTFNDIANKKDYLIYDIPNNVCTVYNYNGVALFTNTPENIGVIFCDNTGAKYMRYSHFETVNDITSGYFDMDSRPVPFITITASIYNPADVDYIDITKGYSIKNSNVTNTIWDNEYNNGDIKLLFRAENTSATYHNDIIIGDNTVSVDYSSNRYSITLNGGDPVDIGTWRNIVLDIDLINGKLSAIPVKTFNSYTNVELMNTIIPVGDLVNPAPTNSIEWAPTSNSLTFNVYSTSVNMDTYGVVMVNPSLNIQDYFTNLDNFYRMKFYNFSTYGNSITINGQTSTVTNGTVTYDGETVKLKDLNVTYANGHTYIGDSNLEIDLGETTDYNISMTGAWYFQTMLEQGYTELKNIYEWDWGAFILDNTQFCIIYMGLALVGLVIARRFCNLSIIDYSVLVVSAIIAFTVQVVA